MKIQMLVSAVNQDVRTLAERMNIRTDAVIINQCGAFGYEEYERGNHTIRCYSFRERGVGLSRNNALMRADAEISVFADEDIVYDEGYEKKIEETFAGNGEMDMILFNVKVAPSRRTYWNEKEKRVRWYNYGRYPAYSIAARTESLHRANVGFSLLFGGGARYSNGEDSLFLRDCLRQGLKIMASPYVSGKRKRGNPHGSMDIMTNFLKTGVCCTTFCMDGWQFLFLSGFCGRIRKKCAGRSDGRRRMPL